LTIFGNTKQVIQDYDTVFDNSILLHKNDPLRITYFRIPVVPGLHFVPWHRGSGCLGAAAPVTVGAAADEHNLNVVDCDASVTVPRLSSIPVLKWGSGGYPQPPEANVKDNGFPWPPPVLLGIFIPFGMLFHTKTMVSISYLLIVFFIP
jgi:hypothetical protein